MIYKNFIFCVLGSKQDLSQMFRIHNCSSRLVLNFSRRWGRNRREPCTVYVQHSGPLVPDWAAADNCPVSWQLPCLHSRLELNISCRHAATQPEQACSSTLGIRNSLNCITFPPINLRRGKEWTGPFRSTAACMGRPTSGKTKGWGLK